MGHEFGKGPQRTTARVGQGGDGGGAGVRAGSGRRVGRAAAVLGIVGAIADGRGAWGAPAAAPAPEEPVEPFVLEPVVVTGTRSERKLSEAPVATEVIGRE